MKIILQAVVMITIIILVAVGLVAGLGIILTNINISMGPYKCIDIDGNEIICEQTWRSHGTLYGITKEGRTIDLKSYEEVTKETE